MCVKVSDIDEEYINQANWLVKENANKRVQSVVGLEWYRYQKLVIEKSIEEIFEPKHLKLHKEGWFHIHKLNDGGDVKLYCCGLDLVPLLEKGLITGRVDSKPPKHLDSAIDLIINLVYLIAIERTGACGFYGFDVGLAPFVRHDPYVRALPEELRYRYVKQQVQRFVFNCNYPSRAGYQSPFTNLTIAINNPYMLERPAIYGGEIVGKLGDYIDEAMTILRALCELYIEGDAIGRPFTFPIPTVVYEENLVKLLREYDMEDLFWDVVRLRGSFYFMNGNSGDAFELFSFCCRVIANAKKVKLLHKAKGIWVMPPTIGSIGYVGLNMPRIVAWAMAKMHEEKYIYDKIQELVIEADKVLMTLRQRYERFVKLGLYPISTTYLGKDFLKNYYNTIAVIGMAEAYALLAQDRTYWYWGKPSECVKWYRDVLSYINGLLNELEEKTGVLHNLEQSPAESASYRLAKLDWNHEDHSIRDYIRLFLPIAMLYTSQITPPYCQWDIWTQLDVEAEVQPLFTGGVVKLVFDHAKRSREEVKKIIDYAIAKGVVYVAYTPTISHCEKCGWWDVGKYNRCPRCGSIIDYWSRIVGYYTPTSSWNEGKRLEFEYRVGVKI